MDAYHARFRAALARCRVLLASAALGLLAVHAPACGDDRGDSPGGSTVGSSGTSTGSTGVDTSATGPNPGETGSTSASGTPTSDPVATSTITTADSTGSSTTTGGSTTTGDTVDGSTTTTPGDTSDATSDGGPCAVVHQGDLFVKKDTDLASLGDIGRVAGNVFIIMHDREQADLAFLECLHTIDGELSLQYNQKLESTKGLYNLNSVSRIQVFNNYSLRSIDGIGPITDLLGLIIDGNPALEEIHLDSVESIDLLVIGHCEGMMATAMHNKLIDLSGFSGLASVQSLNIEGNTALMAADVLDALTANGGAQPLLSATIRYNLLLPEADVHAKLDVLGLDMQHRDVCGNAGGNPECYCVVG